MILSELRIQNFRSIKDSNNFSVTPLLALIGENNSGKSNIMSAVERLTSAGAGGVSMSDFNDSTKPIVITAKFSDLTATEKKRWQSYLVNGELLIEKRILTVSDSRSGKDKIIGEFHGYRAEPKEWYLSIPKIEAREIGRPKWKDIVEANGMPDYFIKDGRCTKDIYKKALSQYIEENDIEYDEPDVSESQALGLQSNVIASLPSVYFLKAITDYSDEIDKRASSSTFRRLMGDLSDRILRRDPDYSKVEGALQQIRGMLNSLGNGCEVSRLGSLCMIEQKITELLKRLMPSVSGISLEVNIDEIKDIFSSGISLSVNDGVETDVLAKGHGLQRCVVFTLLQTLIMNEREQLIPRQDCVAGECAPIILAIEEPELYIHPQLAKLFHDVMKEFAESDQVMYATHSPLFIDAFEHDRIAMVQKPSTDIGTVVRKCDTIAFDGLDERKIFKGITRLNPSVNELFFAKSVLLVEGPEDQIAVTAYLMNEGKIKNRIEEIDWSIIVAGGKDAIPFFQRVMNAFSIPYVVLHDMDILSGMNENNKETQEKINTKIKSLAGKNTVVTFPIKLEKSLELEEHLKDQYDAHLFFKSPENITEEFRSILKQIFI